MPFVKFEVQKINSPCVNNRNIQFFHLRASCVEKGKVAIPQININLYSVQNKKSSKPY
jgi:hypothetical protein